MKCQKCGKPATFHITELTGGEVVEIHLCEQHAKQYLQQIEQPEEEPHNFPAIAGVFAKQLKIGDTAEELTRLDQQACPVCGITFYEFRNMGRFGCPNDYVCFSEELEPLIVNIHGDAEHTGKRPKRASGDSSRRTNLIRLRREMKEAVEREDYEQASQIRDEIRRIESESPAEESGE